MMKHVKHSTLLGIMFLTWLERAFAFTLSLAASTEGPPERCNERSGPGLKADKRPLIIRCAMHEAHTRCKYSWMQQTVQCNTTLCRQKVSP